MEIILQAGKMDAGWKNIKRLKKPFAWEVYSVRGTWGFFDSIDDATAYATIIQVTKTDWPGFKKKRGLSFASEDDKKYRPRVRQVAPNDMKKELLLELITELSRKIINGDQE